MKETVRARQAGEDMQGGNKKKGRYETRRREKQRKTVMRTERNREDHTKDRVEKGWLL